jgi:hypothetical protein
MLKTENNFIECCIKIEHLKNQLNNTFDLTEKDNLKKEIKLIYLKIDNMLDEYNEKI